MRDPRSIRVTRSRKCVVSASAERRTLLLAPVACCYACTDSATLPPRPAGANPPKPVSSGRGIPDAAPLLCAGRHGVAA